VIGLKRPADGLTSVEKEIEKLLSIGTVETLYGKLPTSRMKFLVAAYWELNYNQQVLANILDVTQEQISYELAMIRKVFLDKPDHSKYGTPYKPRREKAIVSPAHVIKAAMLLSQQ
jgi:hypothetical protein